MVGAGKSTVEIIIAAKDRTKAAFAKVNTQMSRLKRSSSGLTKALAGMSKAGLLVGVVAIAAVGAAAIKAASDFDKAFATIRTGTGATGETLKGLESSFKRTFTTIPASTAAAATAIADLNTRLGLSGKPLEALAAQFLNLSRITGTDVAANISSVTRVMHDFDVSTKDQSKTLDYLFKVSQSTGLGVVQLGNNMTQYGSVMRQMGFDINESAALLGKFEKEGVNLQLVLGSLRMGLANFAKAGEEPVEALARVIKEIQGMGSVADANLKAIEIFGSRAGPDMAAAIREGRFEIGDLMATLDASSETINAAAADALTFGDKFKLMKNQVMTLIEPLGRAFIDTFEKAFPTIIATFSEIGGAVQEAFESISRQAGPALEPLIAKFKEVGEKIGDGLDFKTLADDVGVFIGAALNPLIRAFTWLIDKLGPLWDMIGKGAEVFHNLANALKTEEGRLDDILDATEKVTKAKQDLFDINEKLRGDVQTLSDELEKAGGWTTTMADLEANAALKTLALSGARLKATEVIAKYGADSEIAKTAIENVKIAEEAATAATTNFNTAVSAAVGIIIDSGVATEGLEKAQLDFTVSTEAATAKQADLKTAVSDLEIELEEAKQAPFDLGIAFENFGKKVKGIFAELPLRVAEAIAEVLTTISKGFDKIHLSGFADNFGEAAQDVRMKVDTIREGLEEDIPEAMNVSESVITDAAKTIVEGLDKIPAKIDEGGVAAKGAAEEIKDAYEDVEDQVGNVNKELIDNVDAFEKSADAARSLIDLDWSVFTEFEASLPRIDAGIGDMESSFVGLKGILEDNIVELENVKQSVMDISEIAAPFLEAGFLDGIKAIGNFAGALKDASSAIGAFSSLQDVNIEGCINFSRHVHDMVTALQILEDQMEDLVPSFETMDSLIDDIAVGFLGGIDINAEYGEAWGALQKQFGMVGLDMMESNKLLAEVFGLTLDEILLLHKEGDLTTFAFMKQTNAMKLQTTQLKKITDALQPYLEFMRTLNELAALSTLSTEKLNNGLNSIKDTLNNLGVALSTFDLRPIMESLFGEETGTTNEFTKTMEDYESKFSMLVGYVDRFSTSILTLVNSFEALTNISKSVLADQTKLKEVFEGITTVMTNFSVEMGGAEGFAQKFAAGIDAMLKSAEPLMKYFQDNKEAITQFNNSLRDFGATITNILNVFEDLASAVKRSSELVVISTKDMEAALALIPVQLGEIAVFLGGDIWGDIVKGLSAVDFSWKTYAKTVDVSMPVFTSAMDTFSALISKILGLSVALKDMRDMSVLSVRDIDEALKNIPVFLDRFVDALALNMSAIKQALKELDKEWSLHAEEMKATMPSYEDSTTQIGKLVGSLLSLNSALKQLAEMGTISGAEFDTGFKSLMESISNFAVSLAKNVDGLIDSLSKLSYVWNENKATLVPLMDTFLTVTYSFWEISNNANAMAESFRDLQKNSITLEKGFKSLIDFINQVVESTKEFYTTEAAAELATFITDVGKVIDAFVDLERDLNDAMDKIKGAISTAVDNIEGKISSLSSLIKSAYAWGANMMGAFITGMDSMSEQLAAAAMRQAGIVEEYLGAASPTKSGPLSHLDEWPRNLVQSYSGGIEAEMHTLNHSFAALAPNMGAAGPASSTKSVNIYLTQNIGNRSDADYSVAQLRREMIRHEVM